MRFTLPCLCNTGISVRKGKGRYRDTHIVTFAPRYLLDNRSTHKLAFAQREFARGKVQNLLITYFNTKYSEHMFRVKELAFLSLCIFYGTFIKAKFKETKELLLHP